MTVRRSGFVAIVGCPNVGKSTLLNHLVGEKLAGVSPKPQTTRNVIRGILTRPEGQIVFLDTPGFHKPHDRLGKWMLKEVQKSLQDADLVYFMVLPAPPQLEDKRILDLIKSSKLPAILLINKVDQYSKPDILPILTYYKDLYPFREMIPISAKLGDQTEILISKTLENLPEGDYLFPEDQISDQGERLFVSEMIREKIFECTGQEVPYASAIVIENFKPRENGLIDIGATIMVERDSQKAIMIGSKGDMLKQIGSAARVDIEKFLSAKVFLQLWVKVLPHWKDDINKLRHLGYQ